MSHWHSQSASARWPLLADWQEKAWLSRAMASEGNFGPAGTKEMKRELSAAETPSLSATDELGQLPDMTSPGPPGHGEREPRDAAGRAIKEERDVQPGSDGHEAKQVPPVSPKGAGKANQFSSLSFPEKLWKMVESDEFRSIWWSEGGKYVAINEELFKEEVLGRERPLRVFATQKMKSFLRQLNFYGFTKARQDFQRSASLPEFLAEEDAASAHSQILYYYNPAFNREHPHLPEKCKRGVGLKRRAPRAPEVDEGHPSRSPDGQPARDTQASPPVTIAPTKRRAEAPPGLGSAHPSPLAAGPRLPEPARAAGIERFTPLAAFFLTPPGSQTPHGLRRAAPWFAMPMLAAASALPKPRPPHGQSPRVRHCPTCTCSPSPADAGNAGGPQHGTY
ncbi:LOW QUALITY PROTEIN: heat shock transcription factor, Y-linked-like [Aquila chrysaetos chrysaetos]|uniref:LOW QUALITY PROTEIN: heat shock transcription factor, Y-linked-like n=1 Tax=Aquila chrysaetos chrysaetos TaxID=223781 RepID=UPI001176526F|nr:LOW QUALITY PROTEIN: heat shock transcription factor, Y-linked-like [Aquila chrysaetos chrysaetos]